MLTFRGETEAQGEGKICLRTPRERVAEKLLEQSAVGSPWPLGPWVCLLPPVTQSPYLYPYRPQKRRTGSKVRVVKTRMKARPHMGSTSG